MKRVLKPWGEEHIFAVTPRFAGKVLFIRSGGRLSLQYHKRKHEAIYVYEGMLEVQIGRRKMTLIGGQSLDIKPGVVHRFSCLPDRPLCWGAVLFEVSTPELEDVVRLEDDYGR